ncbi:MAG TPA: CheR family methyltransferase [Candidatus Micrarchaeaceae archaeon]|nr:CheR family methyltransferase [Candidatus Micrarchaeaceae archaeon]
MSKHNLPEADGATDADLTQVCRIVQGRLGIEIRDPQRADNRLRLERLRSATACTGWQELARRLIREPTTGSAWAAAITNLSIGETHFFRHRPQFDHLRQDILAPLIVERRRESSPWLRLWSAGCSTGEEAYSLAILVRELIPDLDRWNIFILGTDINPAAVEAAIAGRYGEWSFREPMKRLKDSCFIPDEDRLVVRGEIRKTVTFAQHNLLDEINPGWAGAFDLILCRNVTVHFADAAAEVAVAHLWGALRPGGALLVGPAEPRPDLFTKFELVRGTQATSYRRPEYRFPVRARSASPERPAAQYAGDGEPAPTAARPDRLTRPIAQPDAANCLRSARVAADAGQHDAAIQSCLRVLELEPANAEAYFLLGSIHSEQLDRDRAVEMLKKAIYLEPGFALAHYSLGRLLLLTGDLRGARLSLRAADRLLDALPIDHAARDRTQTTAQVSSAADRAQAGI